MYVHMQTRMHTYNIYIPARNPQDPSSCCLQETYLTGKDTSLTVSEGMEINTPDNGSQEHAKNTHT